MATLVLSTVGTILGGPIGGALGSLIGGAIDSQIFGPGPRKGPRLGDLSIQTSSYGSAIPRIYGAMRVAGTVVWATDLKEEENVSGGGKSGPEVVNYAYSASFAVALSSRAARRIGRVWADGKLLRGAAGDLKNAGTLRFLDGSEDQALDPLIASIEGMATTPAFRGLALAVFEDLALVDYGNRIPMISFELIADDGAVDVAAIVADVTRGAISPSAAGPSVAGFAAHGEERRAAIAELVELTGVEVVERDGVLTVAAESAPVAIGERLSRSCTAEGERAKPADQESRRQEAAKTLPRSLALTYYDASRDYQAGQARAVVAGGGRAEWRAESPVVLSAVAAKAIADTAMARRWAGRDGMVLRLDPSFADLVPGTSVELADVAGRWLIVGVTIEQLVVVVEIRREASGGSVLPADGGRAVSEVDVAIGETGLALFDAPDLGFGSGSRPTLWLAATSAGGFRAVPVAVSVNGQPLATYSVARRAVLGQAASVLGIAPAAVIDHVNSVDVELTAPGQTLLNADDDALAMGANAMLVGGELVQFGRAVEIGPQQFRLSQLLRGRRGTEWAINAHVAGEAVVMVDRATLVEVPIDFAVLGGTVSAVAHGIADDPLVPPMTTMVAQGEALRPMAPAHVMIGAIAGGGLRVSWVPRSVSGLAWVDGASDPAIAGRRFAVSVVAIAESWSGEAIGTSSIDIDSAAVAALGTGAATISVSEGDASASSRAATITATI